METCGREIVQLLSENLGIMELNADENLLLRDLNASSMQAVMVASAIEDKFGIDLPMQDYYSLNTLNELIDYVTCRTDG